MTKLKIRKLFGLWWTVGIMINEDGKHCSVIKRFSLFEEAIRHVDILHRAGFKGMK